MSKFDIQLTAERLTAYAIERQSGTERHRPLGTPCWMDQRRSWTDAILRGMARLNGQAPDYGWMEMYDHSLELARVYPPVKKLSQYEQVALLHDLNLYVSELEAAGDDRRQQIDVVRNLMEDIYTHLPWARCRKSIENSIKSMTSMLMHMTAQKPIRFTYLVLSGRKFPWADDFVSGIVNDEKAVKATELYLKMSRRHPQVQQWNVSTTTYVAGDGDPSCDVVDATDFDISIIREEGYRFLKRQGLCAVDHAQFNISAYEIIRALQVVKGADPEPVTMPNTPHALQTAVGGYIKVVGLDANTALVCNEAGKLIGLPVNRQVGNEMIAGPFLVVGMDNGDICSLSDEDAAYYAEQFALPVPSFAENIRVLKIEPGAAPEPVTVSNTLDALQAAVGGYIEVLGLDANAALVCNEEGKLIGLPANRRVGNDIIAGTFLIVGTDDGDFCSLSDEDAAHYAEQFAQPMSSFSAPDEPAQWGFYVL